MEEKNKKFILWFDQVNNNDVALVGGKNASLGEMYTTLTSKGIRVPNGFVVTAHAYKYLIEKEGLTSFIENELKDLDTRDIKDLQKKGKAIREKIIKADIPKEIEEEIVEPIIEKSQQEVTMHLLKFEDSIYKERIEKADKNWTEIKDKE